jgi:integrase
MTPDEAQAILAAVEDDPRLHAWFLLAVTSGPRRGEVGALTWPNVDLDQGVATICQSTGSDRKGGHFIKPPKNGRARRVPLEASVVDALRRLRALQAAEKLKAGALYLDRGFVFADELGAAINLDTITKAFASVARRLGLRGLTLHSARHSVATWALSNGVDVRTIAAVLGHSVPSTTLNIYSHAVAGREESAVRGIGETLKLAKARRLAGENPA